MTPSDPSSSAVPPSAWHRFSSGSVRLFHSYGNWLVTISWKLFFLLAALLLICASVLAHLPPFNIPIGQDWSGVHAVIPVPPVPPVRPGRADRETGVHIDRKDSQDQDITISIDKNGVRITPARPTPAPADAAASAAAAGAAAASAGAAAAVAGGRAARAAASAARNLDDIGVEIKLPANADSADVREAVQEARQAVIEAIRESRDAAREGASEAEQAAAEIATERAERAVRRVRTTRIGDSFTDIAFLWIVASAILKFTYKGTMQAEVKAAVATETAESEQLKRQVVEARMAAMQAQVEPHFLFNTLASIDHLIETDPPRASTMQKNLIALLRASMPSMRESNPNAQTLGREMAVIRPYLEILKVRMEDRLQASVRVPDGLLSAEFPPMMIQSLVENAIKHGLEPKAEGGTLEVSAEIVDGRLAVTVADTGLGFGKADTAGTGIGLANIRERLKLLYGDKASMVVADNRPSGTVVTLTVPYQAQMRAGATA
ncbi:MAG: histidine kinase [Caldimonas sp.]